MVVSPPEHENENDGRSLTYVMLSIFKLLALIARALLFYFICLHR
jgi:hypothetical protein